MLQALSGFAMCLGVKNGKDRNMWGQKDLRATNANSFSAVLSSAAYYFIICRILFYYLPHIDNDLFNEAFCMFDTTL